MEEGSDSARTQQEAAVEMLHDRFFSSVVGAMLILMSVSIVGGLTT